MVWFMPAHFEIRRGSSDEAERYCSKDDTRVDGPWRFGNRRENQGQRNDLALMRDMVRDGHGVGDLLEVMPGNVIRYHRAIDMLRAQYAPHRTEMPEIYVFWGPPGSGKTRRAFDMCLNEGVSFYPKQPGKWWDYYDGQHTIVWDEFYGSSLPFTDLLRLLDRYPLYVERKGGTVKFWSSTKRIIFTSNSHPRDWYNDNVTHAVGWNRENPLYRRLVTEPNSHIIRVGFDRVVDARTGADLGEPRIPGRSNQIWELLLAKAIRRKCLRRS